VGSNGLSNHRLLDELGPCPNYGAYLQCLAPALSSPWTGGSLHYVVPKDKVMGFYQGAF
jgi:hypothetical protein